MAVRRAVAVWAAALVFSCGLLALPLVAFAATSAVNIQGSAFAPATVTVRVGDTVTWTNHDAFSHTSTSDTGAWDTGVIRAGTSGSFVFTAAGTFAYHCAIHAFMHGTIVVQALSTPQPTAPPTAPPTPVRTAPPTIAATEAPTPAQSETPTPQATTAAPSASASPVAAATETASASPSTVAAQVTPSPNTGGGGMGPLLIGAAALAVVGNRDEYWFVRCTCETCGTQGLGVVIVKRVADAPPAALEPQLAAETEADDDSLRVDDVLEAHELLRDYAGDIHGLFEKVSGR